MTSAAVPPRYLRGYGLVELPLGDCVAALAGGPSPVGASLELRTRVATRDDVATYLGHLTHPATRWALFAASASWTAVLTNRRDGSDFADFVQAVAEKCRARTCRVVDDPGDVRRVNGYRVRLSYPARAFELVEPRGSSSVIVRSIAAMLDGDRWVFETAGEKQLPAEAAFDYEARLKRDRFTRANLRTLVSSIGAGRPVLDAFEDADTFRLMDLHWSDERWTADIEARACTAEQADDPGYGYFERGLGWVGPDAESVVADMTRAVLLSPQLEPRAQPYLKAARRRLGRRRFARLTAEAEELVRRRGG